MPLTGAPAINVQQAQAVVPQRPTAPLPPITSALAGGPSVTTGFAGLASIFQARVAGAGRDDPNKKTAENTTTMARNLGSIDETMTLLLSEVRQGSGPLTANISLRDVS